jgi:hypothetical protein
MTGTEPHAQAPRGVAGRGPTGTADSTRATPELQCCCTALYEAAPPSVGPTGTTGRALAVEAMLLTHAHLGTAGCVIRKGTAGCERARGAAVTRMST